MLRHALLALAVMVPAVLLASGAPAAAGDISFENMSGMTPMDFIDNRPVPPDTAAGTSRLSTQLQMSDGVAFGSDADYVALINLGLGHATSGVAGIGGATPDNILKYHSPVIITFTMPGDPTIPAVTSFVSIRGDNFPNPSGSATMEAFDVNGVLLATTGPVPDAAGFTLSISAPNINSVRITQTLSDIAFDDLHFNPLTRAVNVNPIVDAGDDQAVFVRELVKLDGSQSLDPDLDPITFFWTLTTPAGSAAVLTDSTTAAPTFTPDLPGSYTATLTVTDSSGATASDSVVVLVSPIAQDKSVDALVREALNLVRAMPREQVTTRHDRRALQRLLARALHALQAGDMDRARYKLAKSIDRTDGCTLRGAPDGYDNWRARDRYDGWRGHHRWGRERDGDDNRRDWITDCAAQMPVYGLLMTALGAIAP